MKRLFFLIAISFLLISSKQILACTCAEYGVPVCAAYWRSDAVFVGLLQEITPDQKSTNTLSTATLHFIVEQPFRGVNAQEVDVVTPFGTSCDMHFGKGIRYLIYAHRNSTTGQLFAGACSRTDQLKNKTDDLNYILALKQQGVSESISGRVALGKYEPMPGVKVEVRGGNKTIETTTDEKGDYSVTLTGAGSYTVRVLVPSSVIVLAWREDLISNLEPTPTLTTIEYKVEVGKSECDYRELNVYPIDLTATAVVSGIVMNHTGRPINRGDVYLIKSADVSNRGRSAKIEANGSFTFKDVPVGEFFLVLNPDNRAPDENDAPYPRTFYPNASDESGATRIVVSEGVKLENLSLRLGTPWKATTVSGIVVWPEGTAASNAHISLYDEKRYIRMINVDEKGRFSFNVYGDFQYAIEAQVWKQGRQGKSKRIAITQKSKDLKLVINPE